MKKVFKLELCLASHLPEVLGDYFLIAGDP